MINFIIKIKFKVSPDQRYECIPSVFLIIMLIITNTIILTYEYFVFKASNVLNAN